jgi:hypothetical protein
MAFLGTTELGVSEQNRKSPPPLVSYPLSLSKPSLTTEPIDMAEGGFNPLHGWAGGPFDNTMGMLNPYGQMLGYGGSLAPIYGGFFQPPPGMDWYELPYPGMQVGLNGMGYGNMFSDGVLGAGIGPGPWGVFNGPNAGQAYQQFGPVNNGGIPGINLQNLDGGIGLEPGYNYIFPPEHCKIHVLLSSTPPWQILPNETLGNIQYKAHYVPTSVTLQDLMKQFGCNNSDPGKNVLHEVCPAGDGRWYKGITIKGDDNDRMKQTVQEMGWDKRRDGRNEGVVWVYFTKD